MATIPVSGTAQAATTHGAGVSVSTLRSGARTFSLSGLWGSVIVQGDEIELWGSNDGGTTFQPLRSAPGAPVRLSFNNPEAVLNDGCSHYATRRVSVGAGSSLVAVGVNGEQVGVGDRAWVQGGNSWGQIGVLGTQDSFALSLIAESVEVLNSDGTTTLFGNPEAIKPGSSLQLYAGAGGSSWTTDGGGALALSADGLLILGSGTTNVVVFPGSAGAFQLQPRGVGVGDTCRLEFRVLGGARYVGFRSPDALAANTEYIWPTARANLPGRALVSDGVVGEQQLSWGPAIQSGAANLTNGVSAAIAANISATSRIFIQAADVVPGAGNLTIDYRPLAAGRVSGTPGSFTITAVLADGTVNALDQSQGVQWIVVNQ